MKNEERENFIKQWKKYFNSAELPITFYYTDEEGRAETVKPSQGHRCLIATLQKARKGDSLCLDAASIGCFGGKRYLGFAQTIVPNFEYFLSCGIPGKMEGERYKKTPELVRLAMEQQQPFQAPARYIIFKRWDRLDQQDEPQAVIFFAKPDLLAGLFTLANYDEEVTNGVIAPFGAGCASIVYYPYHQIESLRPKAVIGMFDISARPYVAKDELTFSAPISKFRSMVQNMDESFLTTRSWQIVQKRLD
jgi:uncharacterized protein (DUF169 family)